MAGARRTVTVLFADVTDSTSLGEQLDPEAVRRLMTHWFDEARTIIERHGGTVEKFIGDAVMAVFGFPTVHEDDALRALRAAVELRDADVGVPLRIGVNTGGVIAGEGETIVTGDAVNVAARLQQAAEPNGILIGATTYALAPAAADVEPVEPLDLKGKTMPVAAYRLRSVRDVEPYERRLETPLVARAEELARLQAAFERSCEQRACEVVTILGEAGIGKSRLTRELVAWVPDDATVLSGRCLAYGEGITYWPLTEMLRGAAQGDVRGWLLAVVEGDDEGTLVADRLAVATGTTEGAATTDEIFWATRVLFERLARVRPLVVVVDDLQWAEPTFLDLLEHVAYLARSAPILFVHIARPEFAAQRPQWPGELIRLEPLSAAESEELVRRLGSTDGSEIVSAAAGNPLFIEQMLAMGASTAIPPTIQALLAARLERLRPPARRALECASVVGQEFWGGAVRALADDPTAAGALVDLVRQDLVYPYQSTAFPGEDAFQFRHILIRDVAYDTMSKEARAGRHERFAAWIEQKDRERELRHDEIVGYHLEHAARLREEIGAPDDAVRRRGGERLGDAAELALTRGDRLAAGNLLARALALLAPDHPRRAALLVDLGAALVEGGEFAEAARVLEEVMSLSDNVDDPISNRATVQRLWLRSAMEESHSTEFEAEAERQALESIRVFERNQDDRGLAAAWYLLGDIYNGRAELDAMGDAAARSAEHAYRAGDRQQHLQSLRLFGGAMLFGPTPAGDALARCREEMERYGGDPLVEAALLAPVAGFAAMGERYDEAWSLLRRADEIYTEFGMTFLLARNSFVGRFLLPSGDFAAVEQLTRRGVDLLVEKGERARATTMGRELAVVVAAQGRADEALTLLAEHPVVEGVAVWTAWSRAIDAYVFVQAGRADRAERLADEAAELLPGESTTLIESDSFYRVAYVRARAGSTREAAADARRALELYERKEDRAHARLARALLADLAPEPPRERD